MWSLQVRRRHLLLWRAQEVSRQGVSERVCVDWPLRHAHSVLMRTRYVEMLEQQQAQLVTGLQELYRRIVDGESWNGPRLDDGGAGQPRTHDILDRLGALKQDARTDGPSTCTFEEDFNCLQRRLYESGAPPMLRYRSLSLDSDLGQASPGAATTSQGQAIDPALAQNAFPLTPPLSTAFPTPSPLDIPTTYTPATTTTPAMNSAPILPGSWLPPGSAMDENLNFLHRFNSTVGLEQMAAHSHAAVAAPGAGAGPCLAQEWDDEEFKALFHEVVE